VEIGLAHLISAGRRVLVGHSPTAKWLAPSAGALSHPSPPGIQSPPPTDCCRAHATVDTPVSTTPSITPSHVHPHSPSPLSPPLSKPSSLAPPHCFSPFRCRHPRRWSSCAIVAPRVASSSSSHQAVRPRYASEAPQSHPSWASPLSIASSLPPAQPPPPRGPHRCTAPLQLMNSLHRLSGCAIAVEVARSTANAGGSTTPVSTPPSNPQNRTPLDVSLLLFSFPACPRRQFTRLTAVPPPSCHGSSFAPLPLCSHRGPPAQLGLGPASFGPW
jgi:hypothetical protein